MAINDVNKLDLLWKRYIYGVTETTASGKAAIEESIVSNHIVLPQHVWSDANMIPIPADVLAEVVASEINGVPLVKDGTVVSGVTWLAVRDSSIGATATNRLRDFIPGFVDPTYEVKIYKSTNFIESERLLPGTAGYEWVFDYAAGVLHFPNAIPSGVTELYLVGYRYIGRKGVGSGGGNDGSTTDGMTIGTPSVGTFDNGYVKNITPLVTSVADAVEYINRALNDFSAIQPPPLDDFNFVALNEVGVPIEVLTARLSQNHTINFSNGASPLPGQIQPGEPISCINENHLNSDWLGPFGPTNYGTVELWYNIGQRMSQHQMTVDDDSGVFGYLELESEQPFPEGSDTDRTSIRARIANLPVDPGYNVLKLLNTSKGETPFFHFVYNNVRNLPSLTVGDVNQGYSSPFLQWSSGVPHYNINNKLQFSGTVNHLVTDVYLGNRIIEVDSEPGIFNTTPTSVGMNNIPEILTNGQTVSFQELDVIMQPPDGSPSLFLDATSSVRIRGNNPYGDGLWYTVPKQINVMYGNRSDTDTISPIRELRVPITNDLGTPILAAPVWAARIYMSEGDTPNDEITLIQTDWLSENDLPLHEAAVVGGKIQCDRNNYTSGWLPAGPDYSNKPATQWITFMIRRKNVSMMRIEIDGTYSGMWIKLPGISGLDNAPNGWLRANSYYDGYGTPGMGVNGNGCAWQRTNTGYSEIFDLTFGTLSSSYSTNNIILVRFRLDEGDVINGLRFSGVPR